MLSLSVLTMAATLAIWAVVVPMTDGSTARTITSGSMSPALHPGDVVLTVEAGDVDRLGPSTVLTFRRGDGRILTHRLVGFDGDRMVTKGDANPAPDSDEVTDDQVLGVATTVVPYIGLPRLWVRDGEWLMLVAMVAIGVVLTRNVARGVLELPARRWFRTSSAAPFAIVVMIVGASIAVPADHADAAFARTTSNTADAFTAATLVAPGNLQTTKNSTLGLLCSLNVTWDASAAPANGYEYRFGYGSAPTGAFTATAGTTATSNNVLGVLPITVFFEVRSSLTGTTWRSTVSSTSRTLGLLCAG